MNQIIEKCGQSGVELQEIRRHVDADGNDTGPRKKPNNGYLEGKSKPSRRAWGCTRMISHGFGPSKLNADESMPKLTKKLQRLLVDIDDGKMATLPRNNKPALLLVAHNLISWSDNRGQYVTMADGRRVAEALRTQ